MVAKAVRRPLHLLPQHRVPSSLRSRRHVLRAHSDKAQLPEEGEQAEAI